MSIVYNNLLIIQKLSWLWDNILWKLVNLMNIYELINYMIQSLSR
jgi:hypothetical protein